MTGGGSKYVVGIDVGTTTARSLVYDEKGAVVGESHSALEPLMPRPGWYELEPEKLWSTVCQVIREAISSAGLGPGDISGLGISCQRATFTCWSALTGRHCHNLITWKDIRADSYVKEWNARFFSVQCRLQSENVSFQPHSEGSQSRRETSSLLHETAKIQSSLHPENVQ